MAKAKFQRTKSAKHSYSSKKLVLLAMPIVIIAVVLVLELTNTTHFFHKQKAVSGTIPSTTQTSQQSNNNNTQPNSSDSVQNTESTNPKSTAPSGDTALLEPFGNFVSNHNPDLNVAESLKEQSVCTTTPGASCYIKFTQGDVVRTLETLTTDRNGTASWVWDVKQSGLTEGSWTITAVATLNGQTNSATDALKLEVQP